MWNILHVLNDIYNSHKLFCISDKWRWHWGHWGDEEV